MSTTNPPHHTPLRAGVGRDATGQPKVAAPSPAAAAAAVRRANLKDKQRAADRKEKSNAKQEKVGGTGAAKQAKKSENAGNSIPDAALRAGETRKTKKAKKDAGESEAIQDAGESEGRAKKTKKAAAGESEEKARKEKKTAVTHEGRESQSDADDDSPMINKNPRNACAGDYVSIYWMRNDVRGWWPATVQSVGADGLCKVKYDSDHKTPNKTYNHSLIVSTHIKNKGTSDLAWQFFLGRDNKNTASASGMVEVSGCEFFPLYRLLVVLKCFWDDFRNLRKHVEFRPEHSLTKLTPGMSLLLCPPLADRRKRLIHLLHTEVVEVAILSLYDACTRFPDESLACDLPKLCSTWKGINIRSVVKLPELCSTWKGINVGCVVVKGVRPAPEFACLAKGNKGFLHQFSQEKGTPQFCMRVDVGKMATLQIARHGSVETVRQLLINTDSCLTDSGDCLPNSCSDRKDSSEKEIQVKHPQKYAQASYFHISPMIFNFIDYTTS